MFPLRWTQIGRKRREIGAARSERRSEKMPKLTKEFVDRAAPGGYSDSDLRGFELRVGKSGVKTFCVRYRPKGGGRRPCVKIGRYGVITPIQARNEAKRILGLVASRGGSGRRGGRSEERDHRRRACRALPRRRGRAEALARNLHTLLYLSQQTRDSRDRDAESRVRHSRCDRETARPDRQEPSRDREPRAGDALRPVLVRGRARPAPRAGLRQPSEAASRSSRKRRASGS